MIFIFYVNFFTQVSRQSGCFVGGVECIFLYVCFFVSSLPEIKFHVSFICEISLSSPLIDALK